MQLRLREITTVRDFETLVDHYQDPLFGFLGRMGFDQATAEDVAQESFLRAWKHRSSFDANKASVSTWLFTIARNIALNRIQREGCRKFDTSDVDSLVSIESDPSGLDSCQLQRRKNLVHRALTKLSVDDRSALALAYLRELTSTEAATILGCTPAAYRTRLSRARQRLALIIEEKS